MMIKKCIVITIILIIVFVVLFFGPHYIMFYFGLYDSIQYDNTTYYIANDQHSKYDIRNEKNVPVYIIDNKSRADKRFVHYADSYQGDDDYVFLYFDSALYTKDIALASPNYNLIDYQLQNKIIECCQNKKEVQLSEITDFDWDVAYLDYQKYASGEIIKNQYHIIGNLQKMNSDYCFRIIFCKNGQLVKDSIMMSDYIAFDDDTEIIEPDSKYFVKALNDSTSVSIRLSLQNDN